MILYYGRNTCALASHIALEQAGARYEARFVEIRPGQPRAPEFLAVHPLGRVPVLVTQRGTLTETPAILLFIAQSFPGAGLAPLEDPFRLAEMQAVNSFLCSSAHVAHLHRMLGTRWADDPAALAAMQKKVPQSVGGCFALIEDRMLRGPWVLGEDYSVADPYLFTLARWLEADGVDIARFPKVEAHFRRMRANPAVAKVLAAEGAA